MSDSQLVEHLDEVNRVVEEYLKGNDPTVISKQLAIPRTRVVQLINEWKVMASANEAIGARAKEALAAADTHYSKLISRSYEVIDEASMTNNLGAKTAAIKLVMDIERRQEVLVSILKDIASEYPQVRDEIMRRLSSFCKRQ